MVRHLLPLVVASFAFHCHGWVIILSRTKSAANHNNNKRTYYSSPSVATAALSSLVRPLHLYQDDHDSYPRLNASVPSTLTIFDDDNIPLPAPSPSPSTITTHSTITTRTPLLETSLGDIMKSSFASSSSSSVTGGDDIFSLVSQYNITNPLDRILITANGNLQRLISSYYDAPVHVLVESCQQRPSFCNRKTTIIWDRVVHLQVYNRTFCIATSEITILDPQCAALVASQQVGLGQLFRYYNVLPEFTLLQAGICPDNGFVWRDYQLDCQYVSCRIHEQFCDRVWEMKE